VLGFPSLGVWGVLLVWGGCRPQPGGRPYWSLVRALGKYLDPSGETDRCGPQNPAYGGNKMSGDRPRGLSAQGVMSDLMTSGPVQEVLAQSILDKIYHWGSVVGS